MRLLRGSDYETKASIGIRKCQVEFENEVFVWTLLEIHFRLQFENAILRGPFYKSIFEFDSNMHFCEDLSSHLYFRIAFENALLRGPF